MPWTSSLCKKSRYPFRLFFSMFKYLRDGRDSSDKGSSLKKLALKNKYFKDFRYPIDPGSIDSLLFPKYRYFNDCRDPMDSGISVNSL